MAASQTAGLHTLQFTPCRAAELELAENTADATGWLYAPAAAGRTGYQGHLRRSRGEAIHQTAASGDCSSRRDRRRLLHPPTRRDQRLYRRFKTKYLKSDAFYGALGGPSQQARYERPFSHSVEPQRGSQGFQVSESLPLQHPNGSIETTGHTNRPGSASYRQERHGCPDDSSTTCRSAYPGGHAPNSYIPAMSASIGAPVLRGMPVGKPLPRHEGGGGLWGLWGTLRSRPVLVTGDARGRVRLCDPLDGTVSQIPGRGHDGAVLWGAWRDLAGQPLLATGGGDGTVRLWDPLSADGTRKARTAEPAATDFGEPMDGPVEATGNWGAWGTIGPATVLATGSYTGQVHLWDPVHRVEAMQLTGHSDIVEWGAWGRVDGRPVLATATPTERYAYGTSRGHPRQHCC